ncbi:hypothetical protein ACHAXA_005282 [Cyclostephanos tholiformis]|uniref:Mitochondrial carrier protein n=1 Tax=Cyclostephanos tholiformis TaxID=382380 RepID=A0ABD3R928_9STRA
MIDVLRNEIRSYVRIIYYRVRQSSVSIKMPRQPDAQQPNMAENDTENGNSSDGASQREVKVNPLHDLIAGGVAGSASVVVGHPFDTIKVRLQTSGNSNGNGNGSSLALGTSAASGAVSSSLAKFRSLFQGMTAPLSSATLVNAIIFASYGSFTRLWEDVFEGGKHDGGTFHGTMTSEGAVFIERGEHGLHEFVKHHDEDHDVRDVDGGPSSRSLNSEERRASSRQVRAPTTECYDPPSTSNASTRNDDGGIRPNQDYTKIFACGAAAGTVQAFVICPMEHVKCRLQVDTARRRGGRGGGGGSDRVKRHGLFRGLYRGMSVTLWRETPAFGMYFATYDTIKDRVENLLEEKDMDHPIPSHAHAWAASALAGGISGAWTWVIIYPFDVIKTHIQTSPLDEHSRKGMWTVGRELVRERGWRYMFRGLGITVCRAFPVNAIIFPTYEAVLLQLGDGVHQSMHDLVAGGVAGSVSVVVGHPFDTMKVRAQASSGIDDVGVGRGAAANQPTSSSQSTSSSSSSSLRSLFRGVAAPLSTAALFNAVVFASFGSFTRLWEDAFEGGGGDSRRSSRGTVTADGGVFIERGGGGGGGMRREARHRRGRLAEGVEGEMMNSPSYRGRTGSDFESLRGESLLAERRRQQGQTTMTMTTERVGEAMERPFGRFDGVAVGGDEISESGEDQRHSLKVLACGMAAGMVQSIFLCPMEHVKCRLQVDTHRRHRGAVDLCVSIVREHGVLGLNRGMGATLWREAPSFGLYFASYDLAKERVEGLLGGANGDTAVEGGGEDDRAIPSQAHAYVASAFAGGISGALAWLVTYPFDVIKTQIQTSPIDGRYARMGTWAVGHELVQRHGWRHLFRGLGITLVGAIPVNAVIFPTYEWVISQLEEG